MTASKSGKFFRIKVAALCGVLLISVLWMVAAWANLSGLPGVTSGPWSASFDGANALFAGLAFVGVLTALLLQAIEHTESSEHLMNASDSNEKAARATLDKAIFDLYALYSGPDFQGVKDSALRVLIGCAVRGDYLEFVVSRHFVVSQKGLSTGLREWIVRRYSDGNDVDGNNLAERFDRYKLDELMDFFRTLALSDFGRDACERLNFSYPWWRPLFWLVAFEQIHLYRASEEIRRATGGIPNFFACMQNLDRFHGFVPFAVSDKDAFDEYFLSHAKILDYRSGPLNQAAAEEIGSNDGPPLQA